MLGCVQRGVGPAKRHEAFGNLRQQLTAFQRRNFDIENGQRPDCIERERRFVLGLIGKIASRQLIGKAGPTRTGDLRIKESDSVAGRHFARI